MGVTVSKTLTKKVDVQNVFTLLLLLLNIYRCLSIYRWETMLILHVELFLTKR